MGAGIVRAAAAALALAALIGGGCGWQEASTNLENSRSLRVGMTKEEVLEVMGEPIRNEEYCTPICGSTTASRCGSTVSPPKTSACRWSFRTAS